MASLDDLATVLKRQDVLDAIAGAVLAQTVTSFDDAPHPLGAVLTGLRKDAHTAAGLLDAPIQSWDGAQHPLRDLLTAQRTDVHVLRDALPAPVVPTPVPAPAPATPPTLQPAP